MKKIFIDCEDMCQEEFDETYHDISVLIANSSAVMETVGADLPSELVKKAIDKKYLVHISFPQDKTREWFVREVCQALREQIKKELKL